MKEEEEIKCDYKRGLEEEKKKRETRRKRSFKNKLFKKLKKEDIAHLILLSSVSFSLCLNFIFLFLNV